MRSLAFVTAASLWLTPLLALAGEKPAKEAPSGSCGTSIDFFDSPKDASKAAAKGEKLVLVLHVSGNFEDPRFTWNNAEALRVGALANEEVGKYVNEYFCAAFQKVATFKIVGGQKQGGNVAAYFCAPDGRVLHCVAGPVAADVFLNEAKWTVESVKKVMAESKGDGAKFKAAWRKLHAARLTNDYGLAVEAVTVDIAPQDPNSALTYKDPSGRPLAPVLPPPPIEGPDVTLQPKDLALRQENASKMAGAADMVDRKGRRWVLPNQGRVHTLLAAHSLVTIDKVYGTVFENILGEKISTKPVEVETPFPWVKDQRPALNLERDGLDRPKK